MSFWAYFNFCLLALFCAVGLMAIMAAGYLHWFDDDEGDDDEQ